MANLIRKREAEPSAPERFEPLRAIRDLLRSPHPSVSARREALANAMTDCVRLKPTVHSNHGNEQMSRIGG